jgi:rubredoxin
MRSRDGAEGVSKMKTWRCVVCGFFYNEVEGLPAEGIAPGTRWEDIPEEWTCPDCGVSKRDFSMTEVGPAVSRSVPVGTSW